MLGSSRSSEFFMTCFNEDFDFHSVDLKYFEADHFYFHKIFLKVDTTLKAAPISCLPKRVDRFEYKNRLNSIYQPYSVPIWSRPLVSVSRTYANMAPSICQHVANVSVLAVFLFLFFIDEMI